MQLAVSAGKAINACRREIVRLGWEISDQEDGRLRGGEQPPLTCCRALTWPLCFEIRIESESPEQSTVSIDGSMTGLGSRPAQRLRSKVETLESRIRDGLAAPEGRSASPQAG